MNNEAIDMIKMPLSVIRVAAFCLPLALVASCGSGTEAVQGTTILINPQDIAVPVTESLGNALVVQLYDISLQAPSGNAQIDTQVTIDSHGGIVYDVDKSTTPFTYTRRGTGFLATIQSHGVYTVAVDFPVPPAFSGNITVLEVFSGTAFGKSDVVVSCTDSDPAAPPVCP